MAGAAPSSSPWPCSRCTFLNPPSRLFSCQVCLSPSSPSAAAVSSSSPPRWSCRACTFDNRAERHSCEVCGARPALASTILADAGVALAEEPSSGPDANPPVGPSVSSISRLHRCGDKRDLDAEACTSVEDHRSREKLARKEAASIPVGAPFVLCACSIFLSSFFGVTNDVCTFHLTFTRMGFPFRTPAPRRRRRLGLAIRAGARRSLLAFPTPTPTFPWFFTRNASD